jgi:hypothetical protein
MTKDEAVKLQYRDAVHVNAEYHYCWTGITWVSRVLNHGEVLELKNLVNDIASNDPFATFRIDSSLVDAL